MCNITKITFQNLCLIFTSVTILLDSDQQDYKTKNKQNK